MTIDEVFQRVVELEGRVTALEATQRASNTIQEHLVAQITNVGERMDSLHDMFAEHTKDERIHWEDTLKYREQRDREDRKQRQADFWAFVTVLVTLVGILVGGAVTLHAGN